MPISFKKSAQILDNLNVKYTRAYEYRGEGKSRKEFQLNLFETIHLPFTSVEWCELCMDGGKWYIGGCCGNTSNLQNYLNDWFRDGGWITISRLEFFSKSIFNHEGFENWNNSVSFNKLNSSLNWDKANPLDKLALIWKVVKDHYEPNNLDVINNEPIDSPNHNIKKLYKTLAGMSWHSLWSKNTTADKAKTINYLSKLIPPLKFLHDNIQKLNPGPIRAYAIVDAKDTEKIYSNATGYCIYDNKDEILQMFSLWDKSALSHKDKIKKLSRDIYKVRKTTISIEKGIEFGGFVKV